MRQADRASLSANGVVLPKYPRLDIAPLQLSHATPAEALDRMEQTSRTTRLSGRYPPREEGPMQTLPTTRSALCRLSPDDTPSMRGAANSLPDESKRSFQGRQAPDGTGSNSNGARIGTLDPSSGYTSCPETVTSGLMIFISPAWQPASVLSRMIRMRLTPSS